jgi:LmbE family N-acetylglucosaminyl deacetylase
MNFHKSPAELFIPDGTSLPKALSRTTALCIAAHHDDIEIMAHAPIAECYGQADLWFSGVTVTDGGGSPRSGIYENCTDGDMMAIRAREQKTAASAGGYAAQFLLAHRSAEVKQPCSSLIDGLRDIILACSPNEVYTHNLADKHDTHVAVALNVIQALRAVPANERPKRVISLEVWRALDWLCDGDKTVLDASGRPNLAAALLGVYDSQISGGKRYDLAVPGRRLANATFFESHSVDGADSLTFGLDITELVNSEVSPAEFISRYIDRFKDDVCERIERLS